MSDLYRLFGATPINVVDRGKVAPQGYVSAELRARMDQLDRPPPTHPQATGGNNNKASPSRATGVREDTNRRDQASPSATNTDPEGWHEGRSMYRSD